MKEKKNTIKIAISNRKGGVGKTGITLLLSQELKRKGYSVLVIDCDSQHNASNFFDADLKNTVSDMLFDRKPAKECIQHRENGDVIPSELTLSRASVGIEGKGQEYRLSEMIEPLMGEYDFIIFDTAAALDLVLDNVLATANFLILPITCQEGLDGMEQYFGYVNDFEKYYKTDSLNVLGIVYNDYRDHIRLDRMTAEQCAEMAEEHKTHFFNAKIRRTAECQTALATQTPIENISKNNKTRQDIESLANEVLKLIKKTEKGKDLIIKRK